MKTKILLALLLAFAANSFAQIGFQENIVASRSYTTGDAQFVRAADVDGDNDLDIIAFGRGINWYENADGMGNFGKKNVISAESYSGQSTSLFTLDFDYDGDIDLLSSMGNKFTLHENANGLGNFQVKQVMTLGPTSSNVVVFPSDINGDGAIDILCFYQSNLTGTFQGKVVWYQNDGSGNFGPEQIINNNADTTYETSLLYTADLDGDGFQDIIMGHRWEDKITWLKNTNGTGTFDLPIIVSLMADGISSVYTADVDNDGFIDIVSTSQEDNQVAWYRNTNGLGAFSTKNIITTNALATNSVLVTDLNNDTTKDIIYTSTNEIGWMSNADGLGTFGTPQVITTKVFGVRSIIMADLDGDGLNDLISASKEDDKVAWYKNTDGTGNFDRQNVISRRVEYPNTVYPGDFDGDGDIDLLINSQLDAKLSWLENVNGLGFYGKEHIITENVSTGNYSHKAHPVDIDGDGDLDIAAIQNSVFFWWENVDGKGNFTVQHVIESPSAATIVKAADMDGDGLNDLVCGVFSTNKISWYKNLGNGIFGVEQIIKEGSGGGGLSSLELADMDGNNTMDIIASSFNGTTYYFKNMNDLGIFEDQYMEVFSSMYAVYPADIDGDGDLDIVGVKHVGSSEEGSEAVVWYENSDGLGNFIVKHDISLLDIKGRAIHAADLDGDGDIDVLTTGIYGQYQGYLAWYKNNGNGVFAPQEIITETADLTTGLCVTTADIDNDNDLDIISVFGDVGNWLIGKISVFENVGVVGNTINGTVLIDTNANGCTNDDVKGSNLMVVSNNGLNSFATFTNQNGDYQLATTEGNFNTAITSQLPAYFSSTPIAHDFNFVGMNNAQVANFCITPLSTVNDLSIAVYPSLDLRAGFPTTYKIVYRNMGTTTLSGTVEFEYNNAKLSLLYSSQTIISQTPNKLTYNFTNLNPLETETINLNFTVFAPPITNLNDEIVSTATINPILADQTESNNVFILNQTVVGSFDPNDITCLEGDEVPIENSDKYLHYIIRFQNTGTASAINVKVENSLDPKLDWTSMQLESLSHNGRVEIKDGSEVKFIFDNIYLKDSTTDEANSHGFIAYKIRPLPSLVAGNIINNTADIYFDFNPAIITNTTSTEFFANLSVSEFNASQLILYPNPTTNELNIKNNSPIEEITIIDINGRILKKLDLDSQVLSIKIEVENLTDGIYFIKIKSNQVETIRKMIKK